MPTQVGIQCPTKGCKGKTEFVAIAPMIVKGQVVQPHTYAVCGNCYRDQWAEVYGDQFGGISYDEYLKKQASLPK